MAKVMRANEIHATPLSRVLACNGTSNCCRQKICHSHQVWLSLRGSTYRRSPIGLRTLRRATSQAHGKLNQDSREPEGSCLDAWVGRCDREYAATTKSNFLPPGAPAGPPADHGKTAREQGALLPLRHGEQHGWTPPGDVLQVQRQRPFTSLSTLASQVHQTPCQVGISNYVCCCM